MKVINQLIPIIISIFLSLFSSFGFSYGWPYWVPDSSAVPFFFTSDSLGNAVGVVGVTTGVVQPQTSLLGMGFYTDKDSYATYGAVANYQLGDRWLIGADLYNAKFVDNNYYLGDQGSNDSNRSYAVTTGEESKYRMSFRYILPWGNGDHLGVDAGYIPNRTISGSDPLSSGVTSLEIQPFYSSRSLSLNYQESEETWGVQFRFDWDNRNDVRNPTEGSRTLFDVTYSPAYKDDTEWATVSMQNSQYWDLGEISNYLSKQVIAFSFYTIDTPTWNSCSNSICHRPPEYEGVKLGGLYRLRSFPSGRYHSRSAIHYSAEYRVMPEWQPLENWPVFSLYDVPWWQWVTFADVGRVAEEYNLKTLHEDMKWSLGGAVRFQVEGVVVRTEMAWGNEESVFRVMVNQPF